MKTFSFVPSYSHKLADSYLVLTSQFENGSVQKRLKHRKPTIWSLRFVVTFPVMNEIRAFFNARRGSYEPFQWLDPNTNTLKTVRFREDSFEIESQGLDYATFNLSFEEVI